MALTFNAIQRMASFERGQAFPLDKWSYFENYESAVAAAAKAAEAGTDAAEKVVYYIGQTLVVNNKTNAILYIIQPDKTLREVGSVPMGDNKSIEVVNEQIKLKGFGNGYYKETDSGYVFQTGFKEGLVPQVIVSSDQTAFELAWFEPSQATINSLQTTVEDLDGRVSTIENAPYAVESWVQEQNQQTKEEVFSTIEDNTFEAIAVSIGTKESFNKNNDNQIPTSAAVWGIIEQTIEDSITKVLNEEI